MPLWSPSASPATKIARATDGAVRVLGAEDTDALTRLLLTDPAAHVSVTTHVRARGTAGLGKGRHPAMILGIDDLEGNLDAACWFGSNIIPVAADAEDGALFGEAAASLRRRVSSIYGRRDPVLSLFGHTGWVNQREVRDHQPLMHTTSRCVDLDPLPGVRPSRLEEFYAVEQACAAMFTEELGFSPYAHGGAQYRERIRALISAGHSLVSVDPETHHIVFKAEFGAVTKEVVQVQGVWVHPQWRGQGIAAPGMAAVIDYGLTLAPQVSLYVNHYNTRAVRAYERAGFEHDGSYATVLF